MSKECILTTQAFPYSTRTANRGSFRLPGSFGRRPIVGLTMFVLGNLLLGVLAYNVSTEGPLLRWAGLVFTMSETMFQGGKKQHVRTK
jgi:hypothetical protein